MELTIDEKAVLSGEEGEARKKAMKLLVGLGEFYGAQRLIPVASTQISGVSYKTGGEALITVLEEFVNDGVKVSVPSYLNPAGMDRFKWKEMGIPPEFARKQERIIELYSALGIETICSCTPYQVAPPPGPGEHVAWAESSAVSYCNSVLGARTNREGSLSALASAVVGRTPEYGLHLDADRVPGLRVYIDAEVMPGDLPLIGKHVGRLVENDAPIFTGLNDLRPQDLKALGAAMAATGSVALYHVEGVTPEAGQFIDMNLPQFVIDEGVLEDWRKTGSVSPEGAELVVFGCPHCGPEELEEIAGLIKGRKVSAGKRLWVFTPRALVEDPSVQEFLDTITAAGGEVYADTCCVVAPLEVLGLTGLVTDSGKASVYLKNFCKTAPVLMSRKDCVEFALEP